MNCPLPPLSFLVDDYCHSQFIGDCGNVFSSSPSKSANHYQSDAAVLHTGLESTHRIRISESEQEYSDQSLMTVNENNQSSALSVIDQCEREILCAYQIYCIQGINFVDLLLTVQAIERFENYYGKLNQQESDVSEKLQYRLQDARKRVALMNAAGSSHLTNYDVSRMNTFFEKPTEKFYFDRDTGLKYLQPNHADLMKVGGSICVQGTYAGIGLSRHLKLKNCICDVLYLKKRKDQIDAEAKPTFLFSLLFKNSNMTPEISARINLQKELASKLYASIDEKVKEWGYERCVFCMEKDILTYTNNESVAKKNHAIIFFYKCVQ